MLKLIVFKLCNRETEFSNAFFIRNVILDHCFNENIFFLRSTIYALVVYRLCITEYTVYTIHSVYYIL